MVTFPLELPAAARFWHAYLHKVLGGTLPRTPTPTRTRTLNPTPIPTLT